jgi:hypothetical protein
VTRLRQRQQQAPRAAAQLQDGVAGLARQRQHQRYIFDKPGVNQVVVGGDLIIHGDLRFVIYDLRFVIYDLRFTICDLRFTICDLRFVIYDLRLGIDDWRFTIGVG